MRDPVQAGQAVPRQTTGTAWHCSATHSQASDLTMSHFQPRWWKTSTWYHVRSTFGSSHLRHLRVSSPCHLHPIVWFLSSLLANHKLHFLYFYIHAHPNDKNNLPVSAVDRRSSPLARGAAEVTGTCGFGAETHPADQPGIWLRVWNHLMPETLFTTGLSSATVDSTSQHRKRIILTRLGSNPRRVPNDRLANISASPKLERKKKKKEGRQCDAAS